MMRPIRDVVDQVRTRYYRLRYRKRVQWGAGVQVKGRLRLRGPGRIDVGNGCVFTAGAGVNVIHAAGPGCVRIGAQCHLEGLNISATDNVTIGVLMLMSLFALSMRGKLPQSSALNVELVGLYWHFVDVVWIVIFTLVYLIKT